MRVYRVAQSVMDSPFPIGPYQYWSASGETRPDWYWRMGREHNDMFHDTPLDEGYYMTPVDVCAFSSELSLMEWFDGYLDDLGNHGFRIWEYETPKQNVIELSTQVVVPRVALTLVNSYPINPERNP